MHSEGLHFEPFRAEARLVLFEAVSEPNLVQVQVNWDLYSPKSEALKSVKFQIVCKISEIQRSKDLLQLLSKVKIIKNLKKFPISKLLRDF